jgi:hypothetical protein
MSFYNYELWCNDFAIAYCLYLEKRVARAGKEKDIEKERKKKDKKGNKIKGFVRKLGERVVKIFKPSLNHL